MRWLTLLILALSLAIATPTVAQPTEPDGFLAVPDVVQPVEDVVETPAPDVLILVDVTIEPVDAGSSPIEDTSGDSDVVVPPVGPGVPDAKVPTTDEEAGVMVGQLLDAAQNGHWLIVAGLLLLILMWVFNKLGLASRVGRQYVPWLTLGTGVIISIAVALAGGGGVLDAVKLGLLEGGVAIALWELIFKRFTKAKTDGTLRAE